MHYFSLFYTKPALIFRAIGRTTLWECFEKILDENSIEKLSFKLFLEKLVLKIEPSQLASFFFTIFPISGEGVPVVPPGYGTDYLRITYEFLNIILNNYLPFF